MHTLLNILQVKLNLYMTKIFSVQMRNDENFHIQNSVFMFLN